MFDFVLKAFFAVIYFIVFGYLIYFIFRNTHSIYMDLLTIACWIVAFIASIGLANYTVEKIKDKYQNK